MLINTNSVNCCAKIVFLQNCRDVKNEVFEKKLHFLFLSFDVAARETETKKNNGRNPKKPMKIVILKVVIQK